MRRRPASLGNRKKEIDWEPPEYSSAEEPEAVAKAEVLEAAEPVAADGEAAGLAAIPLALALDAERLAVAAPEAAELLAPMAA